MIKNKNGSWILCVSKKLPGRLYHYNVVTKEAVWNLSDVKLQRKPFNNEPTTNRWTFPEPEYSPDSSTGNAWMEQNGRALSPKQFFGQTVFPKYGPNEAFCPAPAPQKISAMPYYDHGPNRPFLPYSNAKPPEFDRREPEPIYYDQAYALNRNIEQPYQNFRPYQRPNLFSQNGNQFGNAEKFLQAEKFQQPNFTNYRAPDKVWPSTFSKNECSFQRPTQQNPFVFKASEQRPVFSVKTNTNVCKANENSFATKTGNHLFGAPALNKPEALRHNPFLVKKTETPTCNCSCSHTNINNKNVEPENRKTRSVSTSMEDLYVFGDKIESNIFKTPITKYSSKENLSADKYPVDSWTAKAIQTQPVIEDVNEKPDKGKALEDNNENKNDNSEPLKKSLPETDLRHMLTARRRKMSEKNEEHGPTQVKKIKTSYDPEQRKFESPKKKVTFDLGVEDCSEIEDDQGDQVNEPETVEAPIEADDVIPDNTEETGPIYFVPDTEVLLTKYPMLEELVQLNDQYALLIAQTVKREVESLGVGLCNGRSNVINARQVLRKLAEPPEYITVQASEEAESGVIADLSEDAILICCLQALDDGYLVWLVTDNEQLHKKAELLEINSTTVVELKEHMDSLNKEVSFELKKTGDNNNNKSNSFDTENVNGVPVNCTRKKLFGSADVNSERIQFFRAQFEDLDKTSEIFEIRHNTAKLSLNDFEGTWKRNNTKDLTELAEKTVANDKTALTFKNKLYSNFEIKRVANKEFNNEDVSKELAEKMIADDKTTFSFKNNLYSNFKIKCAANKEQEHDADLKTKDSQFKILDRKFSFLENGCQEMASTDSKKKMTSINSYNLNDHLRRFYVKNSVVEERIVRRFDEWLCSFSQILEVTLLDTLKSLSIPLPIHEDPQMSISCLVECLGTAIDNRTTSLLTKRLSLAFSSCYVNNGIGTGGLTLCLTPNDFMTMLAYGTLLIKSLKAIHPECKELEEGELLLEQLLNSIENGSEVESANMTPIYKNTQVAVADQPPRVTNFVKNRSDILDYLKNNCPDWKDFTNDDAANNNTQKPSQAKVLRTSGKKLGNVTLNLNKTFSLKDNKQKQDNPEEKKDQKTGITTKEFIQNVKKISGPKLLKKLVVESTNLPPKMQEIDIQKRENVNKEILNMIENIVEVNNGEEVNGEETEDRVAKKTKIQRIVVNNTNNNEITKKNSPGEDSCDLKLFYSEESEIPLDCNETQFSKSNETNKLDQSLTFTEEKVINEKNHDKHEKFGKNNNTNVKYNKNIDSEIVYSDKTLDYEKSSCTVDSGFHENTVYVYIRKFLAVVTKTFDDVRKYIENTMNMCQKEGGSGSVYEITVFLKKNMDLIIQQLKNIKDRNAFGTLSPSLILNCNAAANDVELRTYRQIVKKLLLQARSLRDALLILQNDVVL